MKFEDLSNAFQQDCPPELAAAVGAMLDHSLSAYVTTPAKPRIATWHPVIKNSRANEKGARCACGLYISENPEAAPSVFVFEDEVAAYLAGGKCPKVYYQPPSRFCPPCSAYMKTDVVPLSHH